MSCPLGYWPLCLALSPLRHLLWEPAGVSPGLLPKEWIALAPAVVRLLTL